MFRIPINYQIFQRGTWHAKSFTWVSSSSSDAFITNSKISSIGHPSRNLWTEFSSFNMHEVKWTYLTLGNQTDSGTQLIENAKHKLVRVSDENIAGGMTTVVSISSSVESATALILSSSSFTLWLENGSKYGLYHLVKGLTCSLRFVMCASSFCCWSTLLTKSAKRWKSLTSWLEKVKSIAGSCKKRFLQLLDKMEVAAASFRS